MCRAFGSVRVGCQCSSSHCLRLDFFTGNLRECGVYAKVVQLVWEFVGEEETELNW